MTAPRAAVIGGGPAGLMAGERLARAGIAATIYERMPTAGRKLLMAGRGGLNLTHSEPLERFLARYGGCAEIRRLVGTFPPEALRAWAEGLGQELFVGSSGRVFPRALKASPLLRAWLARLAGLGVGLETRWQWTGWDTTGALAFLTSGGPVLVNADVTILALGGASWPRLGSDGAWTGVLAPAGVAIAPLRPANCGVRIAWSADFAARFAGTPLKRLRATCGGETATGEAVVTRGGLEGGVIYALGPAIRAGLAAGDRALLTLDLRTDLDEAGLARRLARPRARQSTATFLRKAAGLPPVAIALAREAGGGPLPTDPDALARLIKAAPLAVTGLAGLERAISTAGGVRFDGLDAHLMLRHRPGVFVAGEMLDWEAPTGGYLLQGVLASAVAAADGACAWLAARAGTEAAAPLKGR